jgi:hypothetical protein
MVLLLGVIGTRLTVQEAALLDGGTALVGAGAGSAADAAVVLSGAVVAVGRGEVRDVLGNRVLGAYGARVDRVALAGLGHGIVAAVKVLAVLQVLREVVRLGGQLAVEAEEALLLGRESLDVNLVLLVRVHDGGGRFAVGRREKKKRFRDGVVPRSGLRAEVGSGSGGCGGNVGLRCGASWVRYSPVLGLGFWRGSGGVNK